MSIEQTVDDMLLSWVLLRDELAASSRTENGQPCCSACGATSGIKSVASGVYGCWSCLGEAA